VTALPRVGLVEACEDPQLLGLPLWPAQRRALAAADRGGVRTHVWCQGRRSAKSTSMELLALWSCLLRPELRGFLRPRERGYAVAVAPNLRQSRRLIGDASEIVRASPLLASMLENETADELAFANGMTFAAFPCTARGGRGWPIFALLLDEAAWFVADETEGFQTADQVWRALAPATAQFGAEARIVVGSTPYGTDGFFPTLYQQATSGEFPDMVAQHATTAEANPTIDRAFLEQERARDPEGFRAEYEAEFVGSGGAFFDPLAVSEAVADRGELPPGAGTGWVAGLDPAFSDDAFAVAIVGIDRGDTGRLVLGAVRSWKAERRKPGSLEEVRQREDAVLREVAEFCNLYGASAVTDQYKAAGVVDRLRRFGVAVRTVAMTGPTKTAVFRETRARFSDGTLELYAEAELLAELRRVRRRFTGAGRSEVHLPRVGGSHCDRAQALALATWAHRRHVTGSGDGMGGAETESSSAELRGADALAYRRSRQGSGSAFPRPGSTL